MSDGVGEDSKDVAEDPSRKAKRTQKKSTAKGTKPRVHAAERKQSGVNGLPGPAPAEAKPAPVDSGSRRKQISNAARAGTAAVDGSDATRPSHWTSSPTGVGALVRMFREQRGLTQKQLAEATGFQRSVVAHLEQGRALPEFENLKKICEFVGVPEGQWRDLGDPEFQLRAQFEVALSELIGADVATSRLGSHAQRTLQGRIAELFQGALTSSQALDTFSSILIYYGVLAPKPPFFGRYLGPDAFNSTAAFQRSVTKFQAEAIRIFATFSEAYRVLSQADDLDRHLAPLQPRTKEYLDSRYRLRTKWDAVKQIPDDRLPDLGYISAKRVRQEETERQVVSDFLKGLASSVDKVGVGEAVRTTSKTVASRMDSLLRKFNSTFQFSLLGSMFAPDSDQLLREAERLGPKEEGDLVRMQQTQETAQQNLSSYLAADHLDVYVATSMRSDADFVSVNRFVEALFDDDNVKPFRLRYFNPTQSWIEDRVAKGLVEALMLRRAEITIYMAQKEDTFGKDSEAS